MAESSPQTRTNLDRWVFARIDEIHAAALRWRDELVVAAEKPDTAEAVATQLVRMPQIKARLTAALEQLQKLRAAAPLELKDDAADNMQAEEDEWIAGSVIDLQLIWEKITNAWPPNPKKPAEAVAKMKQCADYLDEIVFICKQRTLTPDIRDMLQNVEVGCELDLEFVFGADLPKNPEKRKLLILELAQEREVLGSALVDSERGVIYRLPPEGKRWKSYWFPPLLVLAIAAIIAVLPLGHRFFDAWPFVPEQRNTLICNYVLWILGAFAHVLIQVLRQQRTPTMPAFAVSDNWLAWLTVKQRSIRAGILWISLGFILLSVAWHNPDWKTMLLAGYSSDSLTDLFVQRFETASDTVKKSVTASNTSKSESSTADSAPA